MKFSLQSEPKHNKPGDHQRFTEIYNSKSGLRFENPLVLADIVVGECVMEKMTNYLTQDARYNRCRIECSDLNGAEVVERSDKDGKGCIDPYHPRKGDFEFCQESKNDIKRNIQTGIKDSWYPYDRFKDDLDRTHIRFAETISGASSSPLVIRCEQTCFISILEAYLSYP